MITQVFMLVRQCGQTRVFGLAYRQHASPAITVGYG
jgi:hypothetical protein